MADQNVNKHPQNAKFENTPGVRRRILTNDRLQSYTLAKLGFPHVDVEVSQLQFGEALERTLDEYNKWMPRNKYDVISQTSGTQNQYNLETLNKPYGRGVVDVRIASKADFFSPQPRSVPARAVVHLHVEEDLQLRA